MKVYWVAGGWSLFILLLCSIPGRDLPSIGFQVDKVAHFILFLIFGWLWLSVAPQRRPYAWVLLGGVLYAIFTEIYQGWLPWERTPDPMDVLADVLGLMAGLAWYAYYHYKKSVFES